MLWLQSIAPLNEALGLFLREHVEGANDKYDKEDSCVVAIVEVFINEDSVKHDEESYQTDNYEGDNDSDAFMVD